MLEQPGSFHEPEPPASPKLIDAEQTQPHSIGLVSYFKLVSVNVSVACIYSI